MFKLKHQILEISAPFPIFWLLVPIFLESDVLSLNIRFSERAATGPAQRLVRRSDWSGAATGPA
ncbi:MAG TPA: hypothetical protein VK745_17670, partial [Polyangiaceae bacterium]|nr:hypothetical protein [Polyangiaceae bacterium]